MKRDPADGLPIVGSESSSALGVRPGGDISIDTAGNVVLDKSGMSVFRAWRNIDFTRIPKRLKDKVPGARGANSNSCYTMGVGRFERAVVASGLELIPDEGQAPITHGVIAPIEIVPLTHYQADLANTRDSWRIDET